MIMKQKNTKVGKNMNLYCNKFILLEAVEFKRDYIIHLFDTKEQLKDEIKRIHKIKNKTNQSMTEFSYVFEQGQTYPSNSFEEFSKERDKRLREGYSSVQWWRGSYFISYKVNENKTKQHEYEFVEALQDRMDTIREKGFTDVLILHTAEARKADYYYDKEIAKVWG